MRRWPLLFIVTIFTLTMCKAPPTPQGLSGNIIVDGSSTVYPITEAMAEEFQKLNPNVRITVGISGTGGGFRKFCAKEIDIVNASRAIKALEVEECRKNGVEFIELKVAFDGLAVVVNPQNDWVDYLTVEELKKIWEPEAQEKITRWSQIRPNWPDKELRLYGPGVDSGTYDYFTEVIVGKGGSSRGDFLASEDDNVLVQGVASDPLALGYFGLAYYEENADRLKLVPIDAGAGPILPSYETVIKGLYKPLSRPLFIYVNKSAAERPEVQAFVEFYLNPQNAGKLVREVGYIPLPEEELRKALERFRKRVTGSEYAH
ncbi:MAG: PstS family phosphate ABC transporter substrate-binding protein [Anaerolineae bacterium]|nr:PstS family phosphate ABC transporter substrate-binding protein [Anaerolineae bacterium]MDW8102096.1 PstS family phosphate ABC transporter substrate-binding protein [Anaerolineae bacterium]